MANYSDDKWKLLQAYVPKDQFEEMEKHRKMFKMNKAVFVRTSIRVYNRLLAHLDEEEGIKLVQKLVMEDGIETNGNND